MPTDRKVLHAPARGSDAGTPVGAFAARFADGVEVPIRLAEADDAA